jgi:hypothetical protein
LPPRPAARSFVDVGIDILLLNAAPPASTVRTMLDIIARFHRVVLSCLEPAHGVVTPRRCRWITLGPGVEGRVLQPGAVSNAIKAIRRPPSRFTTNSQSPVS